MMMGIPELSVAMSAQKTMQAVETNMLKKAMDLQESTMTNLLQGLDTSVAPPSDHLLDVRA